MVLSGCLASFDRQCFPKFGEVFLDSLMPLEEVWKGDTGVLDCTSQGPHLRPEFSFLASELQNPGVLTNSTFMRFGKIRWCR